GNGIGVSSFLQPSQIYSGNKVTLSIDIENKDISKVDAAVEVFNTGILKKESECKAQYNQFLPKEIKTTTCVLTAPDFNELSKPSTSTQVDYKVSLRKLFSTPIQFDIMSQSEYDKEVYASTLHSGQKSQSFSDPNLNINIEFSKQPPFISRDGEKAFMYIYVTSAGSGFLKDIDQTNFEISVNNGADNNILNCDFPNQVNKLTAIKGKFPPITCEINIPKEKNYLRSFIIIIKYNYDYEIRGSIPITVIR
ncbi:MAG: hypothetical protein HY831_02730, partial [Candidatus Aenigmarchaeota archaeon]|nr:hypothetical protein [Candidatus Aenigmarchaeota archaeon]